MTFDLIIKNGKIVNGAGNPWFKADVGIKNGKIEKIGRLDAVDAEKTIDADGLAVSPGFIDMHNHSDISVFFNPKLESAIRQGITTLVIGNCGISLAPVNPATKDLFMKHIETFLPSDAELEVTWNSFGEYLNKLEEIEMAVNIAPLAGHGTIRIDVMGFDDREPTAEELDEMKKLVAEAMEAGAFGMSTGLIYPPGVYSKTEELVELCRVVAKYEGIYASHIRGEGGTLIESVKEAIYILGRKQVFQWKYPIIKQLVSLIGGKTKETLKLMEEAREREVDVTCDQYPYRAGMTSLSALLPPWVHVGGVEEMLKRLRNQKEREKIRRDIEQGLPRWENLVADCGWENIYISSVAIEKNKHLEGKNLAEIAKIKGEDELDAACNLLLEEEGRVTIVLFMMDEEDIVRVMESPLQMVATDAWAVAPHGVLGTGKPHPRFYGTYPRVLEDMLGRKRFWLVLEFLS